MKKSLTVSTYGHRATPLIKTLLVFFVGIGLGLAFWNITAPVAHAQGVTPMEMIQSNLPPAKTLATATKQQVLDAVCAAVRKWPNDAPAIVRTAAGARKEFAGDIVATAFRCLKGVDCDVVRRVWRAYVDVEPDKAAWATETMLEFFPDCGETLGAGEFGEPPPNVNPPPGQAGGGGGFIPQQGQCQVCHDGVTLTISCNDVEEHLDHGDTAGPCPGVCQVCHNSTNTLTIPCDRVDEHLDHGDTDGPCPPTPIQNP